VGFLKIISKFFFGGNKNTKVGLGFFLLFIAGF